MLLSQCQIGGGFREAQPGSQNRQFADDGGKRRRGKRPGTTRASRRGSALAYPHSQPDTISADNHPDLSPVATSLALRNISALAKAALTGQKKSLKKKRQRRTI